MIVFLHELTMAVRNLWLKIIKILQYIHIAILGVKMCCVTRALNWFFFCTLGQEWKRSTEKCSRIFEQERSRMGESVQRCSQSWRGNLFKLTLYIVCNDQLYTPKKWPLLISNRCSEVIYLVKIQHRTWKWWLLWIGGRYSEVVVRSGLIVYFLRVRYSFILNSLSYKYP